LCGGSRSGRGPKVVEQADIACATHELSQPTRQQKASSLQTQSWIAFWLQPGHREAVNKRHSINFWLFLRNNTMPAMIRTCWCTTTTIFCQYRHALRIPSHRTAIGALTAHAALLIFILWGYVSKNFYLLIHYVPDTRYNQGWRSNTACETPPQCNFLVGRRVYPDFLPPWWWTPWSPPQVARSTRPPNTRKGMRGTNNFATSSTVFLVVLRQGPPERDCLKSTTLPCPTFLLLRKKNKNNYLQFGCPFG